MERFDRRNSRHWWGLFYTVALGAVALSAAITAHGWGCDVPRGDQMEQAFDTVFGIGMGLRLTVYGLTRFLRWSDDSRGSGVQSWAPLNGRWLRLLLCAAAFLPSLFVWSVVAGLVCSILTNLFLLPAMAWTR